MKSDIIVPKTSFERKLRLIQDTNCLFISLQGKKIEVK